HAAAFGLLAYQSAWLRHHYAPEFLAALLNAQPMGFYPPATLVRDGQRRGVETRPPDVNRSDAGCTIEDGTVRVGLNYVTGLGERAAPGGGGRERGQLARRRGGGGGAPAPPGRRAWGRALTRWRGAGRAGGGGRWGGGRAEGGRGTQGCGEMGGGPDRAIVW